jgi:hypothetical protein
MDEAERSRFSRRRALALAGAATALVAVPGWRSGGVLSKLGSPSFIVARAGVASFSPHVGTEFVVRAPAGPAAVFLEEASARPPRTGEPAGLEGEAYSLIFRSRGGPRIPDGIHTVVHPVLGNFPLFVTSVGSGRSGQAYQAVIDRRRLR